MVMATSLMEGSAQDLNLSGGKTVMQDFLGIITRGPATVEAVLPYSLWLKGGPPPPHLRTEASWLCLCHVRSVDSICGRRHRRFLVEIGDFSTPCVDTTYLFRRWPIQRR
jgi:hypothetical protein